MSDQIVDTLIAIGQAGVNWRHLAEQMERQRNEAFAALAVSTAREAALREALAGLLESYDLVMGTELAFSDITRDMFRGAFIGEPDRARAILAQQQPAAASTTEEQ